MNRSLNVVITGAGSGLGAAMARRFAAEGHAIAVTDVIPERAAAVNAELQGRGARSFSQVLDITRDADWAELHRRVMQEWGGIDVLINNAGVAAAGLFEESPLSDWEWVLAVDLMGVVRGCHTFLPLFRQQAAAGRKGHIVNIASFAGLSGMPGISAYGTAKAGVVALSEHLHTELRACGVGVSVICPAFVQTNLLDEFRASDPSYRQRVERWMKQSGVTADDVANDVMRAVRKNRFLVLTHKPTRWAWRLKKWWPSRYYRMVALQSAASRRSS